MAARAGYPFQVRSGNPIKHSLSQSFLTVASLILVLLGFPLYGLSITIPSRTLTKKNYAVKEFKTTYETRVKTKKSAPSAESA